MKQMLSYQILKSGWVPNFTIQVRVGPDERFDTKRFNSKIEACLDLNGPFYR